MRWLQVPSYGRLQRLYCCYAFWHVRDALCSRRFCNGKIQGFHYAKRKLKPHHVRRPLELSYESSTPIGYRNDGILSSCTLSIVAAFERFLDGSRHSGMKRIALPAPFGRRFNARHQTRRSANALRRRLHAVVGLATLPVSGRVGWFTGILDLNNVAPSIGL